MLALRSQSCAFRAVLGLMTQWEVGCFVRGLGSHPGCGGGHVPQPRALLVSVPVRWGSSCCHLLFTPSSLQSPSVMGYEIRNIFIDLIF